MFQEFPRPVNDTKIGFHYYPDTRHYNQSDLARWVPELKKLHASWLTVRATVRRPVPLEFIRGLRAADIEPVVEIDYEPGVPLEKRVLSEQAAHYARAGVRYITILREPNAERQWSAAEWQRPNLVSRVMRVVLPALESFVDAGLYPLLPPLRPGGDYWDTAFLAGMLDAVVMKGSADLKARLGLCIHNYAFNRPVSWGEGGQKVWSEARPYGAASPVEKSRPSEDQRGWRLWEWYDEIVQAKLGRSLPMISGAGGALLGSQDQADLPATSEEEHAQRNLEIFRQAQSGNVPPYLLNQNFWLLAAEEDDPAHREAWFKADGATVAAVPQLRAMSLTTAKVAKRIEAAPLAAAPAGSFRLAHYLLLPAWEWGVSSLHWEAAKPFVQVVQPTIGFRVEEARHAAQVTVVVGQQGYEETVVEQLRAAGCTVETIAAPDHATLRAGFAARAAQERMGRLAS